jgi:hypothetical protein
VVMRIKGHLREYVCSRVVCIVYMRGNGIELRLVTHGIAASLSQH